MDADSLIIVAMIEELEQAGAAFDAAWFERATLEMQKETRNEDSQRT
jgi:hypothetical protein